MMHGYNIISSHFFENSFKFASHQFVGGMFKGLFTLKYTILVLLKCVYCDTSRYSYCVANFLGAKMCNSHFLV